MYKSSPTKIYTRIRIVIKNSPQTNAIYRYRYLELAFKFLIAIMISINEAPSTTNVVLALMIPTISFPNTQYLSFDEICISAQKLSTIVNEMGII